MCVVLYSLGKASFRTISKMFNTSPSLTYRWVIEAGCGKHNKETRSEIKYMEFDKIGNFIKAKGTNFEPSKPLAVASGELWPGYSAIVILQPLSDTEEKST